MPPLLRTVISPLRSALALLCLVGGAALITAGALGPWALVTLFKNIDINLSGIFFAQGGSCLAVAALVLLGARRWPMVCLIGAMLTLGWVGSARREIPRRVKHQVIGAQLAFFPLNRLLDQFHINDVEVGDWNIPDDQLLGPGLARTAQGGWILLLGSVLGLPGDPLIVWTYARTARARCRACGARWPLSRGAIFCPECGLPSPTARGHLCPVCHTHVKKTDRHCISCGTALTSTG
ncbi:MAG: zinc ribbon domain-containing protein [Armatimonadota bacterium]|nr:zinc ribbon domain-containing protein [Armatimonadota bacterium]